MLTTSYCRSMLLPLMILMTALAAHAASAPSERSIAEEAVVLCRTAADAATIAEQAAILARGRMLAEQALAADEHDPKAHFALFCNLGRELRPRGVGLGTLATIDRLRRTVDRALALAPDYVDALTGKAGMLLKLPRLLGGDAEAGERLLRRALAVDPDHLGARLMLAQALAARAARAEAATEAAHVLFAAESTGRQTAAGEARSLLAALGR